MQVPHAIDLELPSHAQIPKIDGVPLHCFWYSEPSFSAGIEVVMTDGVPVRIYSREKTLADCFKYRNKIGLDVAIYERSRPWELPSGSDYSTSRGPMDVRSRSCCNTSRWSDSFTDWRNRLSPTGLF